MPKKKSSVPKYTSNDPYTLFDISGEMKQILSELADAQLEKNKELVEELTLDIIDLIDMHENKYEATVHVIMNSLNAAKGNQEIANQFQAKATANNNLAKHLKERLKKDMQFLDLKTVNAGIYTIYTRENPVPTLTIDIDPEDLPEQFQKIEADTDELRHALSTGEEIDGVTLKKGEHIRISAK